MSDDFDRSVRYDDRETGGRYSVALPDGSQARLDIVKISASHVIASSTFVPPSYRGRNIAEDMVERLIADAREKGWVITPSCWFVADEFARHAPAWDDVLKR